MDIILVCEECKHQTKYSVEIIARVKKDEPKPKVVSSGQRIAEGVCPECRGTLYYEEGCHHCPACGFEKC
ncbi:hypothetical protein LCGC14_1330180 [marine sediment metagenome]|uniref:Uncharacterized protein n=1 Tax=marine sediment metagenome TaxID=412755 RepID=A0A0F9KGV8_9ZZZZ